MGLERVLRKGVKTIDKVVRDLQEPVVLLAWVGQTGSGDELPRLAVPLKAVVEHATRSVRRSDGKTVEVRSTLLFLKLPPATQAENGQRDNPIDSRDFMRLSDGTEGPVVDVGGPRKNTPYVLEVMMGTSSGGGA